MYQLLLKSPVNRSEASHILTWLDEHMGPMVQTAPRPGNEGSYVLREGRWRPIWWEGQLGGVMFYDHNTESKDAMLFKLRWY